MSNLLEIRAADFPSCWQSCGTCTSEELEVTEILVEPGSTVDLYDCLLLLEASKTSFEVKAPCAGTALFYSSIATEGGSIEQRS